MMIKRFNFKTLEHDIFGGITAGIVALPLALAFGIQSGLGAEAGLYGAIVLGFFAAILGGTNTQVSGPTGPITVLTASVIASFTAHFGSVSSALPAIFFVFLLASIIQVLFGILRLGKFIHYIPYPVISGFMTGIGLIIIFLQLLPAIGHPSPGGFIDIFVSVKNNINKININALLVTLATIAIIYLSPKITKKLPGSLIALIVVSLTCYFLKLDVPLIGDIPKGLPALDFTPFKHADYSLIKMALTPALAIAALGSLDSLLTSIIADNKTKTKHHSNQELIGQGVGNFITALCGGLPGAGATMRTVVNINNGGTTKLSGVIHSLTLLAILLGFSKFAQAIPLAVLAGILMTVGFSIIDYRGLKHFFAIPRADAFIILLVIFMTIFVGLTEAVIIGFALASIMFMKVVSEVTEDKSTVVAANNFSKISTWSDERTIPKTLLDKIYIKHLDGPLFFGFTSYFKVLTKSIPHIDIVIFRLRHVPYMDQSGLYAIEDAYEYLISKGATVYLTGLSAQPKKLMYESGLIPEVIPEHVLYEEFNDLIHHLEKEELK